MTATALQPPVSHAEETRGLPSASGIERIMACPGSWNAERDLPDESTEHTERGNRIHAAYEAEDSSILDDRSEADIAEAAKEIEAKIFAQWCLGFDVDGSGEKYREKRLWIRNDDGDTCSAKSDFVAICGDRALVIDLKSGRKAVAIPASNWQLRTQAVAVWQNHEVTHVRTAIVQPLCKAQPPCDYTLSELQLAYILLNIAIAKARQPDAQRTPGQHCADCKARATCPEAQSAAFVIVPADMKLERGQKVEFNLDLWPSERIVDNWIRCQLAGKIKKSFEAKVRDKLTADPASIPGLELGKPGSIRTVSDLIGLFTQLRTVAENFEPFDAEAFNQRFTSLCKLSIGEIEDWYRELTGCTEKQAIEWLGSTGLIETKPKAGVISLAK